MEIIAAFLAVSCIKKDMDNCPVVYLEFECINENYRFSEVTRELELLFYRTDGTLAYTTRYTAAQLRSMGWRVKLTQEKAEVYTLIAHVNYANDHTSVTGKERKQMLRTETRYDANREIDYLLTDTYYGVYELPPAYSQPAIHKVILSKNTNLIHLKIIFQEQEMYKEVKEIASRVASRNVLYEWDNMILTHPPVRYLPLISWIETSERIFGTSYHTLRIWTKADLNIEVDIDADRVYHHDIDIPRKLIETVMNGTYPYDTDEKLEHYDEFEFEILIGAGYSILELK